MKTFLGFTTGLFVGSIAGMLGCIVVLLSNDRCRKYLNEEAEDF